ncbi:MAG: ABC transporter permease, partial [Alphaproteobacteria bacterium]|nr:ABC transporter permease [Alphaproteobacteria bacterium]
MIGYVVHRLLIMIPTLLAISLIVFVIIELPPGDYLESYVAEL